MAVKAARTRSRSAGWMWAEDVFGEPIPRLYALGELGSSCGHLYLSGGNIAECFVTGQIAGRNVAQAEPWD